MSEATYQDQEVVLQPALEDKTADVVNVLDSPNEKEYLPVSSEIKS